ncbi:NUDIX domain-containing protein [Bosea sp. CRIB-10]|uniref:NUDIX domain-containing protein n=1 Tax=Bosea sp. CRIB-10 TaxID=378404 RepID=UPI001FCD9851|nr:NUDIX domain-containing protein [Bosea sp. CRIB-10]
MELVPPLLRRLAGRALHLYFRLRRGMTLGVRAAVLSEAGEVLLVRHTYTPGWHLPGGGVEPNETLADALAKELREEANIALTGPAVLHGVFLNRHVSVRDHVAVFVVRSFTRSGPKQPDREIAEARFFPLSALPEKTTPGTRRRLAEIVEDGMLPDEW